MTVENDQEIDFVAVNEEKREAYLIIVDQLPWDKPFEGEHLLLLQDKLNNYFEFVESGQLYEEFPKAVGCKLIIQLSGVHPLSQQAERFLQIIAEPSEEVGCELKFERVEV